MPERDPALLQHLGLLLRPSSRSPPAPTLPTLGDACALLLCLSRWHNLHTFKVVGCQHGEDWGFSLIQHVNRLTSPELGSQ